MRIIILNQKMFVKKNEYLSKKTELLNFDTLCLFYKHRTASSRPTALSDVWKLKDFFYWTSPWSNSLNANVLSAWISPKCQPEDITESILDLNIKKYTQIQKEGNKRRRLHFATWMPNFCLLDRGIRRKVRNINKRRQIIKVSQGGKARRMKRVRGVILTDVFLTKKNLCFHFPYPIMRGGLSFVCLSAIVVPFEQTDFLWTVFNL
jgi:hypothetical protein